MFDQPPLGQMIHNLRKIAEHLQASGDSELARLAKNTLADMEAWKNGIGENNRYMYELGRKQGYRDKKTNHS